MDDMKIPLEGLSSVNVLIETLSIGPGNSSACIWIVPLLLKFVPELNIVFAFVLEFSKNTV